ncbi:MAG: DUF4381 family protein [Lysobacteraceae bacterium]|nr:MAG: DUF4381 family protein [Xanthomonadaceae bacterium]
MNPQDAPQLRDIHLPPDPAWWPPAPGWWLLAIALIALLAWLVMRARRAWRIRRWRRLLQAELDRAVAEHASRPDPARFAAAVSRLLRRAARRLDARAATLQGAQWLAFLDSRWPGAAPATFSALAGSALVDAPYRPPGDQALHAFDAAALARLAQAWLAGVAPELAHA